MMSKSQLASRVRAFKMFYVGAEIRGSLEFTYLVYIVYFEFLQACKIKLNQIEKISRSLCDISRNLCDNQQVVM